MNSNYIITRACSFGAVITIRNKYTRELIDPSTYSAITVTFAQNQEIIVEKTLDDLVLTEQGIMVQLAQEETKRFAPSIKSDMGRRIGSSVTMQIRAYAGRYDAPGSKTITLDVIDSLNDGVIGDA